MAFRSLSSPRRTCQRLGDAATGFTRLRSLAPVERIPRDCFRRRTDEKAKQSAKTSQVTLWFAILLVATCAGSGCRTNPALRSPESVRPTSFAASNQANGIKPGYLGTVTKPNTLVSSERTISQPRLESNESTQGVRQVGWEARQDADSETRSVQDEGIIQSVLPIEAVQNSDAQQLQLQQVLQSVKDCYPLIRLAVNDIESARGKVISSWGEFDSIFTGHSISQPLGFYQTYRNGVGIARPLYGGGEVYGTYRIGDGNFEPWFGERETNEAGEFKAGFSLPLLKDRAIDKRRAALQSAIAGRDKVEANVESRLLQFERFATQAYWDTIASNRAVEIQERLLSLAEARVDQIEERIEKGDLAKIAEIDNDRFIAKRKNDLIKALRSLEKARIKLSLFLRDENCDPYVITREELGSTFPDSRSIDGQQREVDIQTALTTRPEMNELNAEIRKANIDLQYASNLTLPKIDMKGFAGQDIGGETSSTGDKTPFELQIGVFAEVPLQRREGIGKIRTAQGNLGKLDAKMQFMSDKIRAEIQDAASAVNAAVRQIAQSQTNVDLTVESLRLGRIAFEAGDVDLLLLNIYETSVADAELQLLDAQFKYFFYRSIYETAVRGRAFE